MFNVRIITRLVIGSLKMPVETGSPLRKTKRGRLTFREMIFTSDSDWNVFAAVPQHFAHPDQFSEELIDALDVCRFVQNLPLGIEQFFRAREIAIPKDCDQAKFAPDRQQRPDDAPCPEAAARTRATH